MRSPRPALALCLAALICAPLGAAPLTVARLKYGGGGDWYANPTGLPNLIRAVNQRTTIRLAPDPVIVEPGSQRLFDCPIVFITGHGRIAFTPAERENLRRYLQTGGFIHVDDNYGLDESLRPELRKLLPAARLIELPFAHTLYHCFYQFPAGLPKIHEHHGGPPHGYALMDRGRMVLLYSFNTDINDGWEDAEVHNDPAAKREAALRMGINIVVHALTR